MGGLAVGAVVLAAIIASQLGAASSRRGSTGAPERRPTIYAPQFGKVTGGDLSPTPTGPTQAHTTIDGAVTMSNNVIAPALDVATSDPTYPRSGGPFGWVSPIVEPNAAAPGPAGGTDTSTGPGAGGVIGAADNPQVTIGGEVGYYVGGTFYPLAK